MLSQKRQHIITGYPDRLQQILGNTSVAAVRSQQSHQRVHTQEESRHENHQQAIAQPSLLLGVSLLVGLTANMVNHIL